MKELSKLKLDIVNMTSIKIPAREFFVKIAKQTLKLASFSGKIDIELSFIDEKEMQDLNRVWRGKNKVTDVLSFGEGINQIIICLPYAKRKALKENFTYNQELAMLFCHGILHILGYDHERSKRDEKIMWDIQDVIVKEFA